MPYATITLGRGTKKLSMMLDKMAEPLGRGQEIMVVGNHDPQEYLIGLAARGIPAKALKKTYKPFGKPERFIGYLYTRSKLIITSTPRGIHPESLYKQFKKNQDKS